MTLSDFVMDTIKEVLAGEKVPLASSFAHIPSSDPTLISTPGACATSQRRGSSQTKKHLVTEKTVIEAFESGKGFVCGPDDLLTPSAKDALYRYQNK